MGHNTLHVYRTHFYPRPQRKKDPEFRGPISLAALKMIFSSCVDFETRTLDFGLAGQTALSACWLDGLVSSRDAAEEILRPLTDRLRAAVLGVFGAEITARLSLPFFTLVRNPVFFRTLERMEAIVVALWLFPDFLLSSLALFCAQHCLRLLLGAVPSNDGGRLTDLTNRRWVIWLGGAAAIAAGLQMAPDGETLALWSERIIPVGQTAAAAMFPIIYMEGRSKQRL